MWARLCAGNLSRQRVIGTVGTARLDDQRVAQRLRDDLRQSCVCCADPSVVLKGQFGGCLVAPGQLEQRGLGREHPCRRREIRPGHTQTELHPAIGMEETCWHVPCWPHIH